MVMWCDICGAKLENGETLSECPECLCPFENVDKNSPRKEFKSPIPDGNLVKAVSTDENFMKAMTELYENDPIEYQLKMSQFKANLKQQESNKKVEESTKGVIHCPKCNSTAITTGARGVSWFWGTIGSSKTVNRCANCGYTWKPNGR